MCFDAAHCAGQAGWEGVLDPPTSPWLCKQACRAAAAAACSAASAGLCCARNSAYCLMLCLLALVQPSILSHPLPACSSAAMHIVSWLACMQCHSPLFSPEGPVSASTAMLPSLRVACGAPVRAGPPTRAGRESFRE